MNNEESRLKYKKERHSNFSDKPSSNEIKSKFFNHVKSLIKILKSFKMKIRKY